MSLAYKGKRVLEISDEKGMYCGKLLAEVGMEVIKIEPPEGDRLRMCAPFAGNQPDKERSIFWIYYNMGKKSVTVDIYSPEGQEIMKKLVRTADVVIETLKPGEMDKLGLGYESLKKENPRLIMCSITNFGQTGPYAQWQASSDMIPYAMGGSMFEAGKEGFNYPPMNMGRNFSYNGTCIYAATAILAELRCVDKTGEGCHLDTSVMEAAALWRNEGLSNPQRFPFMMEKRKQGSKGPFPPAGLFPCKDGGVYFVGMALWGILSDWMKEVGMDIGEFDDDKYKTRSNSNPDIAAHEDEIVGLVQELCMKYTKAELYEEGIKRHIPIVPMNSPSEICSEPHFKEREYFVKVNHPVAGEAMYPGAPAKLTKTPMTVDRPAPLLGADNEEILQSLS